jgi:AraC-type DNA-binding domain-containing proteins
MNKQNLNPLPEIKIKDINEKHPNLLIMSLEKLYAKYDRIVTQPHRLAFFQLVLITKGNGTIGIDSQKYRLQPKSLFAASNGQVSILQFDKNVAGYVVFFSSDFIYKYPEDLHWINDLSLFDPLTNSYLFDLSDVEYFELFNIIKKIDCELQTDESFAKEEILFNSLKTLIILSERIKRSKTSQSKKEGGDAIYISAFRKKLEEDYSQSRMVKYYANYLNITSKKLNQIICGYYGKPVKQLIEERVLLEIKRLLIHTDNTVKEIGHSLGFNDPTNFNKFFKRYAKETPADFRALNK